MKAGYENAPLASVCQVFADGDWIESKDQAASGIRLVQTGNVGEGEFKDRGDKARYVDEATFARLRCTEIFPGDCLVSRLPDPVGRACILPETGQRMITAVDCTIVRPDLTRLDPAFFVYFTRSAKYLREVDGRCTGTTRKRVSRTALGAVPVPLPPLEEQQQIVAILDEAFEGLARARANAEANLQNARELFENALEFELSATAGAAVVPLGDHVNLLAGYAFKSTGYTASPDGMRLIRGDNIVPGAVRWRDTKLWPNDDCDTYNKYLLRTDDLLIAMDRTWITAGIKYAVLSEFDVPSLLVQRVARLRCLASLDTNFLALLIGARMFERYVLSIQTGVGVPHISPTQIGSFSFPLPEILDQQAIVDRMKVLRAACDELEVTYLQSIQNLDALRQSFLQKAFAGELT